MKKHFLIKKNIIEYHAWFDKSIHLLTLAGSVDVLNYKRITPVHSLNNPTKLEIDEQCCHLIAKFIF